MKKQWFSINEIRLCTFILTRKEFLPYKATLQSTAVTAIGRFTLGLLDQTKMKTGILDAEETDDETKKIYDSYIFKSIKLLAEVLENKSDVYSEFSRVQSAKFITALSERAPNFLGKWMERIFQSLGDESATIRLIVIQCLLRLTLNDMLLVKSYVAQVVHCLNDENETVSELAKLFFTSLATRDQRLYNALPDIMDRYKKYAFR